MMEIGKFNNKQIVLGGLALLCFVLLFVGGPGPDSSRTFRYGWGLGHLFSFALWSYLYLQWRTRQPWLRQAVEVLLLAFLFGAATELCQAVIGREASWQDLGNDLLGSLLTLVFYPAIKVKFRGWALLLVRLPVLALVIWAVLPFVKVSTDELLARQQFPLLSGFETPLEQGRWGGNSRRQLDHQYVYRGTASLRVDLNTQRYSGVALKYFPADWSAYRLLRFRVYNPATEQFPFYFRIHDQQHRENNNRYSDRFNTDLLASPGWNTLEIPLAKVAQAPKGRSMDLTRIAEVILFVGKLTQPHTIYIDEVELVQ